MKYFKVKRQLTSISILFYSFFCLSQERPNILWITIEDTSPEFVGVYGNEVAETPNIDKLASEGLVFRNAFSTGTVCSPSRTAIITGVKTYRTGAGNHRSKYEIPKFIKGFPSYLRELGYYTSNNFKTDYNVASEDEFIVQAWNESSKDAGWWNRKGEQPFFSVFNFMESHQSRTMTNSYDWYVDNVLNELPIQDTIAQNEFEMPPFYNDNKSMRKQFARVYNSIKLTDLKIGELLERLRLDNLMDNTIIFIFADHGEGIPRGKTNGIDLGYRVPFIAWFPEKYKNLNQLSVKKGFVNELIEFSDLAPTMINLAGGTAPDYMDGLNFLNQNNNKSERVVFLSSDRSDNGIDMVRTVTDGRWLYSRNYLPFMPELKYIRYMEIGEIKQQMRVDLKDGNLSGIQESLFAPRPAEFLFDLENDPWELNNLVNSEEHKEILTGMQKALREHILTNKDIHFLPEFDLRKISETTNAFELRLDNNKYDLEEIYKAAALSGFRTEKVAKKQISLLNDKNKWVRYWAALGLKSQPKSIIEKYKNKLNEVLIDSYEPTKITVATILYENFQDEYSKDILLKFAKSSNPDLALMTINYLLYVKDKVPFISTIEELSREKNKSYNVKAASMDFLGILGLVPNTPEYEK